MSGLENFESNNRNEESTQINSSDKDNENCLMWFNSYESWNTIGVNAYSALSVGTCAFTVLTINGVVSLLSCNSVFSLLSINSAFSILSTNSAFAIGCVDKTFTICFNK